MMLLLRLIVFERLKIHHLNIDAMTDGSGVTLAATDKLAFSDGGTEKYLLLSQIDTLFTGTTQTLTNKTFDVDGTGNSLSNIANATIKAAAAIDATKIADGSISIVPLSEVTSKSSAVI